MKPEFLHPLKGEPMLRDTPPEHRIVLGIGASQDEAIERHFGQDGPPENARIVVRKFVPVTSPATRDGKRKNISR